MPKTRDKRTQKDGGKIVWHQTGTEKFARWELRVDERIVARVFPPATRAGAYAGYVCDQPSTRIGLSSVLHEAVLNERLVCNIFETLEETQDAVLAELYFIHRLLDALLFDQPPSGRLYEPKPSKSPLPPLPPGLTEDDF